MGDDTAYYARGISFYDLFKDKYLPRLQECLKGENWTIFKDEKDGAHKFTVGVVLRDGEDYENYDVSFFTLNELKGLPGVWSSSDVKVRIAYRGKGIGEILHQFRLEWLKILGAGVVTCTTHAKNEREIAILKKNSWVISKEFVNTATKNPCILWVRDL